MSQGVAEPDRGPSLTGDPTRHYRSIGGRDVLFDDEGFLWHADDWSEEVARTLGRDSGLDTLDESHWRVICFLREFYQNNGRGPLTRS